MQGNYQDTKKAEILKPLLEDIIPGIVLSFQCDDDGDEPMMIWMNQRYPVAHRKLTRLFRKDYGKAAESVADAYICGFVRGVRAGIWESFKPLPRKATTRKPKVKRLRGKAA